MSVFHLSQRLLLMGSLATALGAGAVQAAFIKPIPVTPGANAGEITANLTLNKLTNDSVWELKGYTLVKAGVTLTIEPGAIIQGHPSDKGTLLVERGGYLVAAGTAAAPITFQGATNDRGRWGGIVLLGKAFSNQNSGGSDVQYEALDWAVYSGTDDNDSSGVLTYLRLINPGFAIAVDRELNGITLCAVGRKTVIHHIQVHRGDDDGIEWFGGTVNTSHLVVTNAVDDSYDTDHGYSGTSQYMIAIQSTEANRPRESPLLPNGEIVGDRGVECGSHPAGHNTYTNPIWKNITFIDNGRSGGTFEAKEECGGSYQKMVLVSGGVTADSSDWAMAFSSPKTVAGIITGTHIDFKKTYITGKYKKKYDILSNNATQIANATAVLDLKIKALPFGQINSYGLYSDLSASNAQIAADSAGAIVGDDLWYQGWTLPGTVTFPMGDVKNTDPVIAFSSSIGSGYVEAPAGFTLNATVTDADGIALVEILEGTTVLQSSATGSISFAVTGAAAGSHTYTLRVKDAHASPATKTQNLDVVVSAPNTAPVISATHTGNATLVAPANFILTATSSDPSGTALIEVLLNDVVLGSNNGSQVPIAVNDLAAGTYTYKVRARDAHPHNPLTATFEYVVTVAAKPNTAPLVNFIHSGGLLRAPAAFTLSATATDADGIGSLKIFEGDTQLQSVADSVLELPITGKEEGSYTYRVEATDAHGTPLTTTKTITVTVVGEATAENKDNPVVTLTVVESDPLVAPATFNLLATAVDANEIDTLQILLNGEVVATGTSLTLTHKLTGLAAGEYAFTARAKDKHAEPKEGTKALTVTVNAPPANAGAPTVIFNRGGADILQPGAKFTLTVVAQDPNGIDTLQILKGTEVLATGTSVTLSFNVEDLSPGKHTFTARAKDKHATNPMVQTQDIIVEVAVPTAIAKPLRDLSGLSSFSARGQDLLVRSEGNGRVHFTVLSLSGRRVASRSVNLLQGQNSIPMGSLQGVHVVLVSDGKKSRTTRVVFSAGR